MWKDLKDNDYFMSYFPKLPEGKYPDKCYFYTILNTIFDNCIPRLVQNAHRCRKKDIWTENKLALRPELKQMYDQATKYIGTNIFYLIFL